jgi:2-polyprenyl-3-methyl-5-hydroxy-6-metoxy-1,4-benzoquinol methylase
LAVYEGLADDYERHQLEDCAYQTPAAVAREVAQHTGGPVEVIDVGAGTGLVGEALLRAGVDARVAGVDLVEPMLREIDSPAYRQCVVADAARELPIRSDRFDAAVSVGLMEHVIEPKRFVPEMLRVVKPGGIAVLTYVPNRKGQADIVDPKAGLL